MAKVNTFRRPTHLIYAKYGNVNKAYAKMIGRPETHPVKKVIGFTAEMITAVEAWRAKQKPVPNVSESIRRLVEIGLKSKGLK